MNPSLKKLVARARLSEIQAIAIYEAEVFWIRTPARRKLLLEILAEERGHDQGLKTWTDLGGIEIFFSKLAGWSLGTGLAVLPWKTLCRVQAWAEEEASKIYGVAVDAIEKEGGSSIDLKLRASLSHARDQEREHAARFRAVID